MKQTITPRGESTETRALIQKNKLGSRREDVRRNRSVRS